MFAGLFLKQVKPSRVQIDFDHLLDRLRHRLYPESMQVLAFYWWKTVYRKNYEAGEWKALEATLQDVLAHESLENGGHEALLDLHRWIRQAGLIEGHAAHAQPRAGLPPRPTLHTEILVPYICRLMNEWLPVEVARLLVSGAEEAGEEDEGIPGVAVGSAIERLLVRERLSAGTLEGLLNPELFSPRLVYPQDLEILRDVVLFLMGRVEGAPLPVLPATLLRVAPDFPLSLPEEAVRRAVLACRAGREELQIAIPPEQAMEVLRSPEVHIGSVLVTMDGRWWQSDRLQAGGRDVLVYRPAGRLRIDYSGEHARLQIPWLETRRFWSGEVHFAETTELFGRQWRVERCEQGAEGSWLQLVFSRVLSAAEIAPAADIRLRRSRPASVDMGWAALQDALAQAVALGDRDPIEQLRHPELIPLGRALFALSESILSRKLRTLELVETRLRAISFLGAELASTHGRVPWRILPEAVRRPFLSGRLHRELSGLVFDVFEEIPPAFRPPKKGPAEAGSLKRFLHRRAPGSTPGKPSHAA